MSDDQVRARVRAKLAVKAEKLMGAGGVRGVPKRTASKPVATATSAPATRPMAATKPVVRSPSSSPATTPAVVVPTETGVLPGFGPDRAPFDTPVLERSKKIELLRSMDEKEVKVCTKCVLCKTRTNTVFGEGDAGAELMFIGEGPGENEDLSGRPFIGRAGELLTKMIGAMGLSREQVFIANIVKCRPPNNRVPAPEEQVACTPYLERQLEIIRPKVIVTLGLPSTQYMLQTKDSMSRLRGSFKLWRGIKLMPTYHPAYVLRQYTEQTRAAVWSDLQQVMVELGLKNRPK
jgi:uracil-DNA glycosylase